ncbi:FTS and Hook-interacting protein [Caerostris extrusa]|uniref:FTS and Hook-interacting protein n=1 Tax=Caerostris extrusa TaxID=172846 RepID=A0AAV4PIP2_CAEEX|nr:FTS and Hook-interacting protein [Caerostris extrusa]
MSWMFKRDSPLRSSFRKYSFTVLPKLPEGACLEVFRTHWQQAYAIIEKIGSWQHGLLPTADDVTGVINNLDQMITLLLQEAQQSAACLTNGNSQADPEPTGPLLSYLLMEGCLDKLFSWSVRTGEFVNILKLEQLKFYEILVTNCHQDLLFHKPIVRPLLRLLASCGDCVPVEVEKRLIILLNTLCVCLTQFPDLLQVFFGASSDHGSTRSEKRDMYVLVAWQARDALLLCMALSRRNESIGIYIAEHSNFCPVLATGLSGLYSLLPRKLPEVAEDWHQFTPEDISEIPELAMFLNSLEFCNAVIQVAHPLVQEQLMEYLYQGFLVPVLGPALHQNTVEEIVATTAYLELFLRTITEPILQQMFLKFILISSYDTHRILNSLIDRLGAQSRRSPRGKSFKFSSNVGMSDITMPCNNGSFRCMLDLNCEDVLFELVFRYLIPSTHVMVSQRSRVRDMDMYNHAAEKFLSLIPSSSALHNGDYNSSMTTSQSTPVSNIPGFDSLHNLPSVSRGGSLRIKRHHRSPSTTSLAFGDLDRLHSKNSVIGTEWYVNLPECHQSSYMDYLKDAHRSVKACTLACKCWSAAYDGIDPPPNAVFASESKEAEAFSNCESSGRLKLSAIASINKEQKTQSNEVSLLQKANNSISESSVLELSSENLAVLQDSFKQIHQDRQGDTESVPEKDNYVVKNLNKHNEVISSDILQQIVNTEDEKVFWSLVCSTNTPSSIGSVDDSLQTIDDYFNDLEVDAIEDKIQVGYTDVIDSKDECSNADSGVFESRDSCISEKDSDVVPLTLLSAKSSDNKDKLFISIPSYPSKSDLKPCSSSVSETSTKSSNSPASPGSWESFGSPNIGPFLSIILTRLEMMMQNDVYTNLHLTGIISRLACYPQPLLRSFLLNPSLVFQPTVRSFFQVLGSLKQKVDSYSYTVDNYEELVNQSKQFLLSRIQHLAKPFTTRVYSDSTARMHSASFSGFQRGEPRRKSFTSFFRKSSFLRTRDNIFGKEPMLESISDGQGYRYVSKPTPYSLEGEMESVKAKNAIFCAVVLEEFLKELAAIAQEHSIIQLNPDFWDEIDTPWE